MPFGMPYPNSVDESMIAHTSDNVISLGEHTHTFYNVFVPLSQKTDNPNPHAPKQLPFEKGMV